jgi:hypothetical protein
MFIARKMLPKEFKSDADFTKRDDNGAPMLFCVESDSGHIIGNLTWPQACAQARELAEEDQAAPSTGARHLAFGLPFA